MYGHTKTEYVWTDKNPRHLNPTPKRVCMDTQEPQTFKPYTSKSMYGQTLEPQAFKPSIYGRTRTPDI